MGNETPTTLENLRLAVHGVNSPFSCEGTYIPNKPVTFIFKDKTRFKVLRAKNLLDQRRALAPLLKHCKPAPFGEGKKTKYDRKIRDALQLKAENGGFSIENFDPLSAGILKEIQSVLVPHDPNPITAELYSVNVYTEGGHFAPHKDTPRGKGMFGTLVICLPSQFSNGIFLLRHRGVVQKFDWGEAIRLQKEPNQLYWAAFFSDVDHQIEKIRTGERVTLTYLLRRGEAGESSAKVESEDPGSMMQDAWRALLEDQVFLPMGGTLAYPCCHLYHQDARFQKSQLPITLESANMLKGRDHLVAASALQAGLKVTFTPYLFENCVNETWQLDRFPTKKEQAKLRSQMDEADLKRLLPILASSKKGNFGITWIEPPPTSKRASFQLVEDDDSELPAAALLHSCEYSPWGYFGNEGSEIDLYTYAALHIEIPPHGKSIRKAKKPVNQTKVKRTPSNRKGKST